MQECDTLILAGTVITQNNARDILSDAAVAVKDGKIKAVGAREWVQTEWKSDKILDFGDYSIAAPGLINSHAHAAMTFLRGLADDLPLLQWLNAVVFPVEKNLTSRIVHLGSLLGYAELISSGATGCVDMYIFEEAAMEAAEQAGLRCLGGEAVFMFPSASSQDYKIALKRTKALYERWQGHERIRTAVNPHSVYTTTRQILEDCLYLARNLDVPLHIHLAETREETELCLKTTGKRPVEYLNQLGLLDVPLIAAHLVDISEAEIDLLASKKIRGVHNPSSNMKLASGVSPVWRMKQCGMIMGLGTDGPASNNQLNMFTEMGRAALLQKLAFEDPTLLSAEETLDMATIGGAMILGDPELGSLEAGKKADVIVLDGSLPNLAPLHNPISQFVYAASGHECRFTMVNGEILYKDGDFTRFNWRDLLEETKELKHFALKSLQKS